MRPISGFLMVVYLVEVVILGAIGSLYTTENVSTLKAEGELPMLRPFQSLTQDTDDKYAHEAIIPAELAFFSFAKMYDPLVIQGIETNTTCTPAQSKNTGDSPFQSWSGCAAVTASPLTAPRLSIAKTVAPPVVDWATIVEGNVLRSRATEIFTTVECSQTDQIVATNENFSSYYLAWNDSVGSTTGLWAATAQIMTSPQVTIMTMGTGSVNENPVIDENGAMMFAVVAFNFEDLSNMTRLSVPLQTRDDGWLPERRELGVLLCKARIELGTVSAEHEILQVSPGLVARLNFAEPDTERVPYSMDLSTPYGNSVGIFLIESMYLFTCDYLQCPSDENNPPLYAQTIGLVDANPPGADGKVAYTLNLTSMTTNLATLISRNLLSYASAPQYPEGIPPHLLKTHAELWQLGQTKRIFTSLACNIILSIGITCASILVALNLHLQQKKGAMGGSVLQLLDAIGWRKMPNVTPDEWREAGINRLREHARHVMVKGALDSAGKVQLSLMSEGKLANLHVLSSAEKMLATQRTLNGKIRPGGNASLPVSQRAAYMVSEEEA
ncbi:hypothetical protein HDU86_007505 [Geranomyces michiganensis]|nr:hypothetical protein HDU86_007505 [Geranomyces michiganensis]